VLSSMLLLPVDFQPLNRAKQHNSCVHKALDSAEVKVRLADHARYRLFSCQHAPTVSPDATLHASYGTHLAPVHDNVAGRCTLPFPVLSTA